jgi:hypothetical protein
VTLVSPRERRTSKNAALMRSRQAKSGAHLHSRVGVSTSQSCYKTCCL